MRNKKLINARKAKNDEFYTRYEDIENEVQHYASELKGQWIYCPCDDYEWSNFVKYFKDNFNRYQLKHLTATHIHMDGTPSERYDYDGVNETITMLTGNGDFRSEECTKIKDECDIVITNPPFSIFRQFINWLKDEDDETMKKFLVIGSINSCSYKEVFPLVKFNKMYIGYLFNKDMSFTIPDSAGLKEMYGIAWYQSLKKNIDRPKIELSKYYNPVDYPKYDNYDAIEVSKVKDIPMDYTGLMGVPISFFNKYNPKQFEIVGLFQNHSKHDGIFIIRGTPVSIDNQHTKWSGPVLNGKAKYVRLIIRNKHPVSTY